MGTSSPSQLVEDFEIVIRASGQRLRSSHDKTNSAVFQRVALIPVLVNDNTFREMPWLGRNIPFARLIRYKGISTCMESVTTAQILEDPKCKDEIHDIDPDLVAIPSCSMEWNTLIAVIILRTVLYRDSYNFYAVFRALLA